MTKRRDADGREDALQAWFDRNPGADKEHDAIREEFEALRERADASEGEVQRLAAELVSEQRRTQEQQKAAEEWKELCDKMGAEVAKLRGEMGTLHHCEKTRRAQDRLRDTEISRFKRRLQQMDGLLIPLSEAHRALVDANRTQAEAFRLTVTAMDAALYFHLDRASESEAAPSEVLDPQADTVYRVWKPDAL